MNHALLNLGELPSNEFHTSFEKGENFKRFEKCQERDSEAMDRANGQTKQKHAGPGTFGIMTELGFSFKRKGFKVELSSCKVPINQRNCCTCEL